jgi:uncharacterized protein
MVYLETSFIVPLILSDHQSNEIERYLHSLPTGNMLVSHYSRIEFASLLGHLNRAGEMNSRHCSDAMNMFEQILSDSFRLITPDIRDLKLATEILEAYYIDLNAAEALHLAVARNNNAESFLTLNDKLINEAKSYKLSTAWWDR